MVALTGHANIRVYPTCDTFGAELGVDPSSDAIHFLAKRMDPRVKPGLTRG
jgi:hypothetical protein